MTQEHFGGKLLNWEQQKIPDTKTSAKTGNLVESAHPVVLLLPVLALLPPVLHHQVDVEVPVVPEVGPEGEGAGDGLPLPHRPALLQVEHRLPPVGGGPPGGGGGGT